eukprot:1137937-Pelagomonas_calceolata.AAC.4
MEGVLCEQAIHAWRSLDNLNPQEAHASSRIMRTYHTHTLLYHWALYQVVGMKGSKTKSLFTYDKTFLINYYAISHLHTFPVTTFQWKTKGMEIGARASLEFATNVIGTLLKTKSTLSWIAHLRI